MYCSDFVLSVSKGDTVSTLSSSNALKDVTMSYGCNYHSTPVGEMNVVKKMKEVNAVVEERAEEESSIQIFTMEGMHW